MASKIKALEYRSLRPEEKEFISKMYNGEELENIRMGPKGYLLPKSYVPMAEDIYNMELRSDDVFVASYQRSGTTITQELVWLIANDYNYKQAEEVPLTHRYDFLEHAMFFSEPANQAILKLNDSDEIIKFLEVMSVPAIESLKAQESHRFVKTHLPMSLLSPKLLESAKVVYVARDPRDVVVSSHHHSRLFKAMNYNATIKDTWNAFYKDLFIQTPFFEHVKEAWALRHHPNMLFLFYEDVTKKMPETIQRVARFLGKKDPTPAQMDRLCEHLSIENFKNNKSVNFEDMRELGLLLEGETFIRKGKSGGWRDHFDEEMTAQAEQWIADNLRDTDLRFPNMKK